MLSPPLLHQPEIIAQAEFPPQCLGAHYGSSKDFGQTVDTLHEVRVARQPGTLRVQPQVVLQADAHTWRRGYGQRGDRQLSAAQACEAPKGSFRQLTDERADVVKIRLCCGQVPEQQVGIKRPSHYFA